MTPFDKFKLDHLSPSSLNTWGASQAYWALKYGFGYKTEETPSMALGKIIEGQMQEYLRLDRMHTEDHLVASAFLDFEVLSIGKDWPSKEYTAAKGKINGMIVEAKKAFDFISPDSKELILQKKIDVFVPGVEVPVIGYVDFMWDDTFVELKTTSRMPSQPRPEHIRQVATYWKATHKTPALVYVTPKANDVYTPSEAELKRGWDEIEYLAVTLRNALGVSDNVHDLMRLYPADFSTFYWDDDSKLRYRRELENIDLAVTLIWP